MKTKKKNEKHCNCIMSQNLKSVLCSGREMW